MKLFGFAVLACALVLGVQPLAAHAWGPLGDRLIVTGALGAVPTSMPGFLHTAQAIEEVSLVAREPNNLEGAGTSYDHDQIPAQFIALGDDGRVAATVGLNPFPGDRQTYANDLKRASSDEYKSGYLPWAIIDGFEVVRRDLAYWRAIDYMAKNAKSDADKAYFASLRTLREQLTLRDLGFWAHEVGDGSSPLRTSVHMDGWDKYQNSSGILQKFENVFVNEAMKQSFVGPRVPAYSACADCTIESETVRYILASNQQVEHLYQLNAFGAFDAATDAGSKFAADRLLAGATQVRNLLALAWEQSADQQIGSPPISVRDVESGKVVPTRAALGGA